MQVVQGRAVSAEDSILDRQEVPLVRERVRVISALIMLFLLVATVGVRGQVVNVAVDFSEGLAGWRAFGSGVLDVTMEQARSEPKALKMTGRTAGWHSAALDVDYLLADGGTYRFAVYVRLVSPPGSEICGHLVMGENLRDGTTNYRWISADVPLSSDDWVLIESEPYTFDAEEVSTAWLYVEIGDDTASYYIDDFSITGDRALRALYPRTFEKDIPALKDVYKDYFHLGAATGPQFLNEQDVYAGFISYHYGVLVAGNSMKPDALQPAEGRFSWRDADRFVQFAERHNMLLRGHTLLWHNQVPAWFFVDPHDSTKPATSEQLISRMENHIKTVVGRYKGKVHSWDVVNEVLNDSGGLRGEADGSRWMSIIGDVDGDGFASDYIELAFKFAREADPDARLIINDYGLESGGAKRMGMYNLVKRMLENGIPVDGVGLQMHISIYGPTPSQIEETIELFASLKVYNPDFMVEVTEMDMSVYSWMEQKKEITQDLLELQAELYGEIFEVFKRQAAKGNLDIVVLWGTGDHDSWLNDFPIKGRGDAGLLFDKQLEAKPAYYKVVQPDKPWYVTKAEFKGALKLIGSTGQVIANLLPGEYTLDELHSSFDLSDLGKAQLAKGYILEVLTAPDNASRIYVGDDQVFDLDSAALGARIVIKEDTARNVVIGKPVTASHRQDRAARAIDGQLLSSWSVSAEPPYWLSVDLERPYVLTRWVMHHRGGGGLSSELLDGPLNAADFRLQISDDAQSWHDVDVVEGNLLAKTNRVIDPVVARYVRVLITKPSSMPWDSQVVVYEFEVHGFETE